MQTQHKIPSKTLAYRLKTARLARGMLQEDVASQAGLTQQAIAEIEKGGVRKPRRIEKIANILQVSSGWLLFGEGKDPTINDEIHALLPPARHIPLLNWQEAITWCINPEENIVFETTPMRPMATEGSQRCFYLRIKDRAMESNSTGTNRSFLINDLIIADPERKPENGNFVIAAQNGAPEAIFRQFIVDGNKKYLLALNPQYDKIPVDDTIKICAVVIHHGVDI